LNLANLRGYCPVNRGVPTDAVQASSHRDKNGRSPSGSISSVAWDSLSVATQRGT